MPHAATRARLPAVVLLLAWTAAACSAPPGTQLRVSAASSLTDVFAEVEMAYEREHPDVDVQLNLAGSTTLVEQLVQGAPVDVLVTADETSMARALDVIVGAPVAVARNRLVLAVPADAPDRTLAAVGDEALLVGLCAPTVPCGSAALTALAEAGVQARPDTEEPDVRSLLAKLVGGELDVGLVYATDVLAADGALRGTRLDVDATTTVVAAVARSAADADEAASFLAFLTSDDVSRRLRDAGFELPS